MRNYSKRLLRVEEVVREEEKISIDDIELLFSCLPPDYAEAVKINLRKIVEEKTTEMQYLYPFAKNDNKSHRSGLHGRSLVGILELLPVEIVEKVKAKIAALD